MTLFATLAGGDRRGGPPEGMTFTIDFLDLGESVDIQLPPADQVTDGRSSASSSASSATAPTDQTRRPKVPRMGERSVDTGSIRLTIDEEGVGGRPLMLVHGFTGAKEDFGDWLVPLADRGWHVVAPDLRGHGASDKPTEESAYTLPVFAGDVLALADTLGWSRFTLLGHSMGGMIAQHMLLGASDRIEALILMDTADGTLEDIIDAAHHRARASNTCARMASRRGSS